jgi:CheY-like chemotaxis protein
MQQLLVNAGSSFAPGLVDRTILVVEDDHLVRDTIVNALMDADYPVVEAETAEQGLELIERQPVALLFTDIRLPGALDGWQLAEQARALHPNLPVIYATGFSAEEPRLVPNGIFLRKPYLPSTVIATIEKLLGGRDRA